MKRNIQLNAEFQLRARRNKNNFFKEQCIKLGIKKKREKLQISSGKFEITREHFTQRWAQ